MKRFYCTVCKKVRRVRRIPFGTRIAQTSDSGEQVPLPVKDRVGFCKRHGRTAHEHS
jgi:hypothetical protein